jgi:hypothetical protein
MKQLLRTNTVRKVGARFVPRERFVRLRGTSQTYSHSVRTLIGILGNLEHNLRRRIPAWFEYVANCPNFPVSERAAFDIRQHRRAMAFLQETDADMRRAERARRSGEATVSLSIGTQLWEQYTGTNASRTRRRAKHSQKPRVARPS